MDNLKLHLTRLLDYSGTSPLRPLFISPSEMAHNILSVDVSHHIKGIAIDQVIVYYGTVLSLEEDIKRRIYEIKQSIK